MQVYYDGSCPMCTVFADSVDTTQSDMFETRDVTQGNLPDGASFQDVWKEMYVVEDGKQYRGADAVLRVLSEKRGWKWLAWLGSLPGINSIAHGVYRVVAANRHRIPWKKVRK